MSEYVFLFPGQASQFVGMGKDFIGQYPHAKERFTEASEILGVDLLKVCIEGPEEDLKQTRITQPAIFVHSVIAAERLLERGITPVAVAGHSLGEYSALVAAKAFDFGTGIRLVALRGKLMQADCEANPSTMAAVVGLQPDQILQVCADAKDTGIVVPANFNSPGQTVISGEVPAVLRAMELAKAAGARIVKQLQVSGAFHSPCMNSAAVGMQLPLDDAIIKAPVCDVYPNVTGKATRDPEEIRRCLKAQVTAPVLWADTIANMRANGLMRFVEVGPKNVLQGILRSIDKGIDIQLAGTVTELEALL
ncbi:MAG: ACP S-malonyltransferase [bacterium]|nr:ACP S-malonyltransferase [bacterium]